MRKKVFLFCCMVIALTACATNATPRSSRRSQASAPPPATETPWPTPSETPLPTDLPTITPTATFGTGSSTTLIHDTICRMGPGESYYEVVPYFAKGTVLIQGRNETGDWVSVKDAYIDDPICWIPAVTLSIPDDLDNVSVMDYPTLPILPTSITAPRAVCGVASQPLIVKWSPLATDSQYRLYRNGTLVSTQSSGSYFDLDVPKPQRPTVYTYVLQTFNDYSNSPFTLSVSVSICGK